jgi:cytochrome d ubiquinol oxidase subunit I
VLVFGWDRVGPKMHFFSTLMVCAGLDVLAVWIVVANSWQQTPAGYHIVETDGTPRQAYRAEITDFWAMVFNPSTWTGSRTLIGAFILGGFFVMSISAYYLLKNRHDGVRKRSSPSRCWWPRSSLLALVTGHDQAKRSRPRSRPSSPPSRGISRPAARPTCTCSAFAGREAQQVDYGVALPGMLSFLVHWDFNEVR